MRNATIVGAAAWLPEEIRENHHWPAEVARAFVTRNFDAEEKFLTDLHANECSRAMARYIQEELGDVFLGTRRRRVAEEKMTSYEAEYLAARMLFERVDVAPSQVKYIFSYAGVPDYVFQHTGGYVAEKLGMKDYRSYGVDTACCTFIAQCDLARTLVASGATEYVLLLQSCLWTRVFPMSHPVSPSIGDAATAVLIGPCRADKGLVGIVARTHGQYSDAVIFKRPEGMWWDSSEVPMSLSSNDPAKAKRLIYGTVATAKQDIGDALAQAHLQAGEVDLLCSTQPRGWIPKAIGHEFDWPEQKCVSTFHEYAHTGVCGPVLNYVECAQSLAAAGKSGGNIVIYSQGAGFNSGAIVLKR
jgi:3-oxoacyl-[acyl-carrier-protein] synthase-3